MLFVIPSDDSVYLLVIKLMSEIMMIRLMIGFISPGTYKIWRLKNIYDRKQCQYLFHNSY